MDLSNDSPGPVRLVFGSRDSFFLLPASLSYDRYTQLTEHTCYARVCLDMGGVSLLLQFLELFSLLIDYQQIPSEFQ